MTLNFTCDNKNLWFIACEDSNKRDANNWFLLYILVRGFIQKHAAIIKTMNFIGNKQTTKLCFVQRNLSAT